jgi:hypothetical protein
MAIRCSLSSIILPFWLLLGICCSLLSILRCLPSFPAVNRFSTSIVPDLSPFIIFCVHCLSLLSSRFASSHLVSSRLLSSQSRLFSLSLISAPISTFQPLTTLNILLITDKASERAEFSQIITTLSSHSLQPFLVLLIEMQSAVLPRYACRYTSTRSHAKPAVTLALIHTPSLRLHQHSFARQAGCYISTHNHTYTLCQCSHHVVHDTPYKCSHCICKSGYHTSTLCYSRVLQIH